MLGTTERAVLLQNHGVLCAGNTVEEALECAVYTEEGAQVGYLASWPKDSIPFLTSMWLHERHRPERQLLSQYRYSHMTRLHKTPSRCGSCPFPNSCRVLCFLAERFSMCIYPLLSQVIWCFLLLSRYYIGSARLL